MFTGMGKERAAGAVKYLAKVFPRWKTTDELNVLWADLFARHDVAPVTAVIRSHRAERSGGDPDLKTVARRLADVTRDRRADGPRPPASFWDSQRSVYGQPGMTDLETAIRYYSSLARRQNEQGGVLASLVLDCDRDLSPLAGDGVDDAVAHCCGISATELRARWRERGTQQEVL